jgi:hypothetical protein
MMWLLEPMSVLPMKTEGTGGERPWRRASSRSISRRPWGCLSSSCTSVDMPRSEKRLTTVWLIGHWLFVKITTAFSIESAAIAIFLFVLSKWVKLGSELVRQSGR